MKLCEQASLGELNTLGVKADAGLLLTIESEEDIFSLPLFNPASDFVLGGGSNVLFETNVPGTVFMNRINGLQVIEENSDYAVVEAGAGENWHQLVLWSLAKGYSGLENLSLIPGLVGAAPVQNIGAYGVELSSVLETVTSWDWQKAKWKVFNREDCQFKYRDSCFKSSEPGRYLITSVRLRLEKKFTPQLEYGALRDELRSYDITRPNATQVSDAVIRIRQRKLPDPAGIGNAGSFFKNPLVAKAYSEKLKLHYSDLPAWPDSHGRVKLSAGWMIEHCGMKGYRSGDAGVSRTHSLVLVNHGSASGQDIAKLALKIRSMVFEEFGIQLEQEPVSVRFS